MAKSDFLRCVGAVQILIENAERLARIDLDRSKSEKERNHCANDKIMRRAWFDRTMMCKCCVIEGDYGGGCTTACDLCEAINDC